MATIAQLNIFPIKSCRGIAVSSIAFALTGIVHDRNWMLVDETGEFMTQREHPRMALIETGLRMGQLVVRAPGMIRLDIPVDVEEDAPETWRRVRVWGQEVQAVDEGELCAAWFSRFLGTPCRLVKIHPESRRTVDPKWTGGRTAYQPFSDGYPVLVASQASLDDLNERLRGRGQAPVGMERFRPNVVLAGVEPYAEDHTAQLRAGEVVLEIVKPCVRCKIPDTDQSSAVVGNEPGDTLATYRRNPRMDGGICFAQNAIIASGVGSELRVGQTVELSPNF